MPATERDTPSGRLSREQVLDELEFLATVEHSLVVEYLTVCCALGHDLPAEEGGATTTQTKAAAGAAFSLAQREMYHLKGVTNVLLNARRSVGLGRATSISSDSVAEIAFGLPGPAELHRLLEREEAIASAVDERYARLRPAVTSQPVFDRDRLAVLQSVIVEDGPTHAESFAIVRGSLGDRPPADFLRVIRREANDAFEQRLLDVSDRTYGLIVAALREQLASFAVTAMFGLDEVNRVLVQRGLLPPFTLF